jgi:hypothetical protein
MAFQMFVQGADQDDAAKLPMKEVEKGLFNNNIGTRQMSQRREADEEPDGGEAGYEEETRPVG